ncbi:hypothetical protein EV356DRAFT_504860 [Viridothelium virens]|uniref:histone acetyltransferase n=1 Tax=Viridothelium virens TaxID=1048519 RepID=A0A6A6H4P7_VIRVR|nr:hypothetical protein EV356DRAFT_504860 [Viridothelium virens]
MVSSQDARSSLAERLAKVLPKDVELNLHHISTPPTRCGAIFSPPPGAKPERTYCEKQFLAVSIKAQHRDGSPAGVLAYAIEVYIYTTAHLTTVFVSKADSTGYISLLSIPRHESSPLRSVSTTFILWLVESRRRPGRTLVVSLFARAQDQYLFPGSIDNGKKHVLDDRSLVKWWCRVLDPLLATRPSEETVTNHESQDSDGLLGPPRPSQGYLIVPGFDKFETASFLPQSYRSQPKEHKSWQPCLHPLYSIAPEPAAPPRCLVPHFPDDPKSRFLDDLDEELPDLKNSQVEVSPSKKGSGQWRSIKSLDQFWEMMAFRQECSSGRMVGFIWIKFTAFGEDEGSARLQDLVDEDSVPSQPTTATPPSQRSVGAGRRKEQKLTGVIHPRLPRLRSSISDSKTEKSTYYYWPRESRGEIVLDEKGYERAHNLLLQLDFISLNVATSSTEKWIEEVGAIAGRPGGWDKPVIGTAVEPNAPEVSTESMSSSTGQSHVGAHIKTLDMATIKKKRKPTDVGNTSGDTANESQVKDIPISSIRKKPKPS